MKSFQSKEKPDVDTILTANWYLLKCKLNDNCCSESDLARKYLTTLISKSLKERAEIITTTTIIY